MSGLRVFERVSIAGMTEATQVMSREKKRVAVLYFYNYEVSLYPECKGKNTYTEDRNKLADYFPFLVIELKLPQFLQSLVGRYAINGLAVLEGKLHHIMCRVPARNDITRQ